MTNKTNSKPEPGDTRKITFTPFKGGKPITLVMFWSYGQWFPDYKGDAGWEDSWDNIIYFPREFQKECEALAAVHSTEEFARLQEEFGGGLPEEIRHIKNSCTLRVYLATCEGAASVDFDVAAHQKLLGEKSKDTTFIPSGNPYTIPPSQPGHAEAVALEKANQNSRGDSIIPPSVLHFKHAWLPKEGQMITDPDAIASAQRLLRDMEKAGLEAEKTIRCLEKIMMEEHEFFHAYESAMNAAGESLAKESDEDDYAPRRRDKDFYRQNSKALKTLADRFLSKTEGEYWNIMARLPEEHRHAAPDEEEVKG